MSRSITVKGRSFGLRQEVSIGPHHLIADELKGSGGNDEGPDPYELLLAALGACTNMTLRMYADRKGWSLDRVETSLSHFRSYATDCAECNQAAMVDHIKRSITLTGELSDEQRQRLLAIANQCPVHRTLTSKIEIQTDLAQPSPEYKNS